MVSDLAAGLARRGHSVRVYCAEGSEVPGVELVTVPRPGDAATGLVMPGGAPPPPALGVAFAIAGMFEALKAGREDVISQHAFDAPAFDLAAGLPALHTLHLPPMVPSVVEAAARVPARQLATVSKSCLRSWTALGVGIDHVLPNGVADFEPGSLAFEPAALVAGRLSPEKGVEHALEASRAARLPVKVVGAAYDPAYRIDLDGAEVLGALPRDELRRLMAACAVTVCAIRWEEPFGLVAAEAQMAGCPVAGYRRGALPEVVEEGVSGILADPDDIEGLATAIRKCLELDRRLVRSSAQRRLSLESAIDRYESTLQEVAG
jgi:glycosyltransferase involved in cell wall biosynthesis